MGKIKINKYFSLLMIKALSVVLILAIFSQMNCLKLPKGLCDPVKKIGTQVASDVMKCAVESKKFQDNKNVKKIKGASKKASDLLNKVGVKISLPSEQELAAKMVGGIMSKFGCRRRLNFFKKAFNKVKKGVTKAGNKIKKGAQKVGKAIVKGAKKVAPVAKAA